MTEQHVPVELDNALTDLVVLIRNLITNLLEQERRSSFGHGYQQGLKDLQGANGSTGVDEQEDSQINQPSSEGEAAADNYFERCEVFKRERDGRGKEQQRALLKAMREFRTPLPSNPGTLIPFLRRLGEWRPEWDTKDEPGKPLTAGVYHAIKWFPYECPFVKWWPGFFGLKEWGTPPCQSTRRIVDNVQLG